ncbi:aluminum-activated malate transporter 12-like [Prosopis cineraria]|uniref:aluminum-activated malate transporter 12-like n=1 Tax=Prosopis cineraria TaxID=364024 RepID=UPI00240F9B48|nr:aluminum-activated malate transporter 12-like [Prosopis cineraria]
MGCSGKEKHTRANRKSQSVKPDNCCLRRFSISKSIMESGLMPLKYHLDLDDSTQNPNPDSHPNIKPAPNGEECGWGYCTEEHLEEILLKNLEYLYNEAVSKLVILGYNEDAALKAVLRNGHCYHGGTDLLTNILNNSLAYLNSDSGSDSTRKGNLDESEPVFSDLRQLEEYSLAVMVCLLQHLRPHLSKGDAMWCLLMSDLHVGKANKMEIPVLPEPGDGNPSSTTVETVNKSVHVMSMTPALCRLHGSWAFANSGESDFPANGLFSCDADMTLQRDIEFPKNFNLSPSMKSLLKRNVAVFAACLRANSKQLQTQAKTRPGDSYSSISDSPPILGTKPPVEESGDSQNQNNQDAVNSVLSRFCDLSFHENVESLAKDRKDELTSTILHQIYDLEKQVQERKDWAHLKAMQAARKLSSDLTELKMLRMEREEKLKRLPSLAWQTMWKVGREDPRRAIHALKVGLSLTLVSLLYLVEPLFKGIGKNAIWAVMTVVVVLEFTAGATLCKGLNRGLGTILAGLLAFLIQYIAKSSGHVFQAISIGAAVFLTGAAATYMRFFPYIKKNYDYGAVIFLLTFNLITVSSYRVDNVLTIAHDRLVTIVVGCGICLLMSLLIFPNWSGEDLHNSTVFKLEGLANSIEACVNEYFHGETEASEDMKSSEDPIYEGYKAVLDSKSTDETLALHASWEPRHSRYCHRFPYKQYVKVGAVLRQFGYTVVALHGCLRTEIQTPRSVRALFKDPCIRLAAEVSKVLIELANSIRNRRHCSPEILSDHLHEALQDLNTAIKSQPRLFLGSNDSRATNMFAIAAAQAGQKMQKLNNGVSLSSVKTDSSALLEWKTKRVSAEQSKDAERKTLRPQLSKIAITSLEFSEALPFAAFASLLVETVAKLDFVIEEVEELGRLACFKEFRPDDEVVVTCEKSRVDVTQNHLTSHGVD